MLVRFLSEVFLITLSIILTITLYYPILLPGLAVLLSYREFVKYVAKKRHSSWIPTNITSGGLAVDMLNEGRLRCISLTCEFEKPFDHLKLIERAHLLLSGNEYPELKSYFVRWMGLYFLRPCQTLEMDAVITVNPTGIPPFPHLSEEECIHRLTKEFSTSPFSPCQPLWQIMIFPNVKPNKVVMTIRTHHGLLDGISLMQLLKAFADPNPDGDKEFQGKMSTVMKKYQAPLPFFDKLLIGLELLLVTPTLYTYRTLKSINVNMWTNSGNSGGLISHQQSFSSDRIRRLGSKLSHNGNVIFSAALVGAIREEMLARGDSVARDVSLVYVLPSPKHASTKFGNYASLNTIAIPISVVEVAPRLQRIEDMFRQIRRPARILQWDLVNNFASAELALLKFKSKPWFLISGAWSNTSSFEMETGLEIDGKPPTNFVIEVGPQLEGMPIVFVSLKLRDEVILYVITYESVFPNKNGLQGFFQRVENELVKLEGM